MTDHAERALLFLDVDGTLLPYGGARLPSVLGEWDDRQDMSNPQLAKLVPEHGPRLLALPCDLIWATAWMQDANEVISPLLGLPQLPVADLPEAPEEDDAGVLHWKTRDHRSRSSVGLNTPSRTGPPPPCRFQERAHRRGLRRAR
jgi:hypothetical protein